MERNIYTILHESRKREREKKRDREIQKGERRAALCRSSGEEFLHASCVCGWRKLIWTRSFPEARSRHVTRATPRLFARILHVPWTSTMRNRIIIWQSLMRTNRNVILVTERKRDTIQREKEDISNDPSKRNHVRSTDCSSRDIHIPKIPPRVLRICIYRERKRVAATVARRDRIARHVR